MGKLVVIAAPSGAGKTSLTRALIEKLKARGIPAAFSVSYTTRTPRSGEKDGVDYHFVDGKTFLQMISDEQFLEHAEVFGRRYGTGWAETERQLSAGTFVFLDIDWQGARQVRKRFPGAVTIFIQPPSLAELERRLRTRGKDSEETIRARMQEARAELSHASEFEHVLVNEDFERTVRDLETIVAPASP